MEMHQVYTGLQVLCWQPRMHSLTWPIQGRQCSLQLAFRPWAEACSRDAKQWLCAQGKVQDLDFSVDDSRLASIGGEDDSCLVSQGTHMTCCAGVQNKKQSSSPHVAVHLFK